MSWLQWFGVLCFFSQVFQNEGTVIKQKRTDFCMNLAPMKHCLHIQPHDCYQKGQEKVCCATCQAFKKNIPEGTVMKQKRTDFCMNLAPMKHCLRIQPHDCYQKGQEKVCCATCQAFKKNIPEGSVIKQKRTDFCMNLAPMKHCLLIQPHDCYQKGHEKMCCATCQAFKKNIPGCLYGDLTPEWCRSSAQCISNKDIMECCETCHKHRNSDKFDPNHFVDPGASTNDATIGICPRGDQRLKVKYKNRQHSCKDIATNYPHYCYYLQVYNNCCPSCETVRDAEVDGCGWGDRNEDGCQDIVESDCGNLHKWTRCCRTCQILTGEKNFKK